jgi:hypothetical protein
MDVELEDRGGRIIRERIADFDAWIVNVLVRDDGSAEPERTFLIEARSCENPDVVRTATVPAADFERMTWLAPRLGAEFSIVPGTGHRDHARAAIQHFSRGCGEQRIYVHTGWRLVEGQWTYLHRGGGITARGNDPSIRVELAGNAAGYRLSDPPNGEELARAVKASLGLLDLADEGRPGSRAAAAVLFAATYRAPIEHANFSIQLHGRTGSLKSSVAALAQQHFGPAMDANHLPSSWAVDTPLSIGDLATRVGDAILVVDDFIPRGTNQEVARKQSEAQAFFQGVGNHAGRQRLNPDGSAKPSPPPNCLPISTGEDRVPGGSADARTLSVRFAEGMIDKAKLAECQADAGAGLYAVAMAAFLRWLASRLDEVRSEMAIYAREHRGDFFVEGDHGRTPEILAHLAFGVETFLRFAVEVGVIHRTRVGEYRSTVLAGLVEASGEIRADRAEEPDPCDQFLARIMTALVEGKASIGRREDETVPEGIETLCGWRWVSKNNCWETWPNATRIGWVDGDIVLLQPDSSYTVARAVAQAGGEGFGISKQGLGRMLEERELLDRSRWPRDVRRGGNRFTVRVYIGSKEKQVGVYPISKRVLWPKTDFSSPD